MGQIKFRNYSVTPCNLLVITMHYVNIVLTPTVCGSGERNGVQWRTKVSFGKTIMQALELLQLAKRHVSGQSNVEQ